MVSQNLVTRKPHMAVVPDLASTTSHSKHQMSNTDLAPRQDKALQALPNMSTDLVQAHISKSPNRISEASNSPVDLRQPTTPEQASLLQTNTTSSCTPSASQRYHPRRLEHPREMEVCPRDMRSRDLEHSRLSMTGRRRSVVHPLERRREELACRVVRRTYLDQETTRCRTIGQRQDLATAWELEQALVVRRRR